MRNSSKSKNGAKSSITSERSSKLRSVAHQPFSPRSIEKASRIRDAVAVTSVCPYCAVGCSQLVHVKGGRIINIEGNPESPINEGTLCPKGANTFQLTVNPHRITKVLYRAPYSDHWEERPLDWAMNRIADRVNETCVADFVRERVGRSLIRLMTHACLGVATQY